ncbi:MFS transporter [Candidatus Hydrogenisulfobacillus filiaventi]|uniref:MFS transporter n=1 Tax=Candidatus Hydrogenisulfobacillus filiaventi TaxID=2707344 RepID=A0A6F8ZKR5_9FIRM|nr:MFS transporter [Bacillota bacterium]CAB1130055.1 MFS transporter [Candidatus Hydrogenisulfobacillus filiaventi]
MQAPVLAAGAARRHRGHKWWVLSVTSLGALLSALNFSTLIIALPDLIRSLHASLLVAMWIMMAYMVAQTVVVLMAGSLADRYGRRRLYVAGMALFTVVALAAGFVRDGGWLVALRVLQGIGGAMVMANSTAIVADAFPHQELGRALGINAMVVAVGQIVGPVLGGWLTTDYGWQWTFWFNVPFGVLAVLWGLFVLGWQAPDRRSGRGLDVAGIVTYLLAVGGLLLALSWGAVEGWRTRPVLAGLAAFAIFLPAFLAVERRAAVPLLHLPLFRNRTFTLGNLAATLSAIARMAVLFLLIFYFQGAEGDSALEAGILSIPLAAGMLVVSPLSGWISDRFGATLPATGGILLATVALVGLALDLHLGTPYWRLALWLTLAGVGSGLFNSPNSSNIMNAAGPRFRGEASGIRSLTTNTGMMFSVAFSLALVTASIPRPAMLAIFAGTVTGLHGSRAAAALHGFMHGLHVAFWAMAALSLVAAILSALRQEGSSPAAPGRTEAAPELPAGN